MSRDGQVISAMRNLAQYLLGVGTSVRYFIRRRGTILAYVLLVVAVAYGNAQVFAVAKRADEASKANRALAIRVAREAKIRVNESCIQSETRYNNAVQQLDNTYKYLLSLTPQERQSSTLNKFIVKNLPKTEQDARDAAPPRFCDQPGIGLPEPNPIFPDRPKSIRVPGA